ncbi:MAG: heparan-alpha-glucosaminide N-acetyltransferase domain-containing protein [Nitrosomonas sp.]|nr:heparan-alpha-glucosaminide N-acetyltransferase domain-containing protein [Nitrosomonas sp.]
MNAYRHVTTGVFDKTLNRISAIDWMRGIVMILMALDHASGFFNSGRIFADSVLLYESGSVFASDQFLTRWVTHICAPTFIFLTGASIAISNAQRLQQGMSQPTIDCELWIRGVFIVLLDICVFSLVPGKPVLQVLYAIGVGMMLMVWLRRLGMWIVLIMAMVILTGSELLLTVLWQPGGDVPVWLALTFAPVFTETYTVLYPAIPWLAMMMLGWVFGGWLISKPLNTLPVKRLLLISGLVALVAFVLIRGLNGYGNMFLLLEGNSIVQWLHVSKYPPSLSYTLLELGLMAIMLAALIQLESVAGVRRNGPVLVFGQTALFFYLAHFAVLALLSAVFDRGDLEMAYLMALLALLMLYPVCLVYRRIKWQNPQSVLRFV